MFIPCPRLYIIMFYTYSNTAGGTQEAPRRYPGEAQEAPRRHPGSTQEAPRRHPGGTQETPRKHPGDPQEAPRGTQRHPRCTGGTLGGFKPP